MLIHARDSIHDLIFKLIAHASVAALADPPYFYLHVVDYVPFIA